MGGDAMYPKKRPKTDLEKFYEAFGKKVGCKPEQYLRRKLAAHRVRQVEDELLAQESLLPERILGIRPADADLDVPCRPAVHRRLIRLKII